MSTLTYLEEIKTIEIRVAGQQKKIFRTQDVPYTTQQMCRANRNTNGNVTLPLNS